MMSTHKERLYALYRVRRCFGANSVQPFAAHFILIAMLLKEDVERHQELVGQPIFDGYIQRPSARRSANAHVSSRQTRSKYLVHTSLFAYEICRSRLL